MSAPEGYPGLSNLKESQKYSDLKLQCGDQAWNVHSAIICPQSDFFAKACEGPFKESSERLIELHDDDSFHIALLLEYFYTGDYDNTINDIQSTTYSSILEQDVHLDSLPQQTEPRREEIEYNSWSQPNYVSIDHRLSIDANLYSLGDKYSIPRLKILSIAKFKAGLKLRGFEYAEDQTRESFGDLISTIWSTTPSSDRGLRELWMDYYAAEFVDKETRNRKESDGTGVSDFPISKTINPGLKDIPEAYLGFLERIADLQAAELDIAQKRHEAMRDWTHAYMISQRGVGQFECKDCGGDCNFRFDFGRPREDEPQYNAVPVWRCSYASDDSAFWEFEKDDDGEKYDPVEPVRTEGLETAREQKGWIFQALRGWGY